MLINIYFNALYKYNIPLCHSILYYLCSILKLLLIMRIPIPKLLLYICIIIYMEINRLYKIF